MDSDWNSACFAPGQLACLLCKDTLVYVNGDRTNFVNHLKNVHQAKFHHNLMLAITFMDNDPLNKIISQFENTSAALTFNPGDEGLLEENSEDPDDPESIKDFGENEVANKSIEPVDVKTEKKKVQICEHCDKTFSNKAALNKHTSKNHQNGEKRKKTKDDENTGDATPPKSPKLCLESTGSEIDIKKVMEYDYIITNSEYFKTNLKQITSKCNINLHSMGVFSLIDPELPSGWKMREHKKPDGSLEKHYLAPDGRVIKSKKAAVEYVKIIEKYSAEQSVPVVKQTAKSVINEKEKESPKHVGDLLNRLPLSIQKTSKEASLKIQKSQKKKERKSISKGTKPEKVVEAKKARRSGVGTECPECHKVVSMPKQHMEDMHSPPGHFPCRGCSKVFTSKNKESSHYSRACKKKATN